MKRNPILKILCLMSISLVIFWIAITVFDRSILIAPILITVSVYLFGYIIVEISKNSSGFKTMILSILELIFG